MIDYSKISDNDLVLEVIHDLERRSMLCEAEGYGDSGAEEFKAKASALRRIRDRSPLTASERAHLNVIEAKFEMWFEVAEARERDISDAKRLEAVYLQRIESLEAQLKIAQREPRWNLED